MIQRSDILSIPYLKKSVFTGSFQGMRYRLEKAEKEEGNFLKVIFWEGPYCYDATSEEKKQCEEFYFTEEGVCQAVDWLNCQWEGKKEIFLKVGENW